MPSFALAQDGGNGKETLEGAILALQDPFVARIKALPPPPPPVPVVVTPKPVAPPPPPRPVTPPTVVDRPSLSITGIIINPKRPMAIINGIVVGQGETLTLPGEKNGKVFIKKISTEGVEVSYMGTAFTFRTKAETAP